MRRYQRKRGFHRTLVLLLTLVMLAGVCFPGLRASAEGETADVVVKAGEKAEYSVSGEIGEIFVSPQDGGLVCNKEDGKIVVDATSATPGTYKVVYVSGSDSDFGIEVTFTVLVLPAAEPEAQTEESEPAVTEDDETDAAEPSEETTAPAEEAKTEPTGETTVPEATEETIVSIDETTASTEVEGSSEEGDEPGIDPQADDALYIEQGGSASKTVGTASGWGGYTFKYSKSGVTASNNAYSKTINVTADANAEPGDYVIQYGSSDWWGNFTKTGEFTVTVTRKVAVYTITFNPNTQYGGKGEVKTIQTDEYGAFVTPDPETIGIEPQDGYEFVGWHEKSATVENNVDGTYNAGMQISVSSNTTYYALWTNPTSSGSTTGYFFIRLDGQMPYEPGQYVPAGYTNAIVVQNALRAEVAASNVAATYNNLANMPADWQIQDAVTQAGGSFDPETQEVIWYVIKMSSGAPGTNVTGLCWHIDGVIRDKDKYWVYYDPNTGKNVGIPTAKQYFESATVEIEYGLGSTAPQKDGYEFLGWDENKNATTPTYPVNANPNSFSMPAHDVTLYAIWRAKDNTEYKIEYYLEQEDGTYQRQENDTVTKSGRTDSTVNVTEDDIKSFTGYEYDRENTNNVTSGTVSADGNLTLKLYYKRAYTSVTVKKNVTGNMGDYEKDFSFTAYVNDKEFDTFPLKNGGSHTLKNVPLGAKLVINETNADGYTVSVDGTSIKDATSKEYAVYTVTSVTEGLDITFTNDKTATIDTGVFTDTAPYIILFSVAAVGAAVLLAKKRRYQV